MLVRANNLLTASPADRITRWTRAGYSQELARQIVAFQELGIAPKGWEVKESAKVRAASSALFASEVQGSCGVLAQARYENAKERSLGFKAQGGAVGGRGGGGRSAGRTEAGGDAAAVWRLVCE